MRVINDMCSLLMRGASLLMLPAYSHLVDTLDEQTGGLDLLVINCMLTAAL